MCVYPGWLVISGQWQSHDGRTAGSMLLSSPAIFSSYYYKSKGFFYFQYFIFFLNRCVLLNVLNCFLSAALHYDDVLFVGFPLPCEVQSNTISWCLQELVGALWAPEHLDSVFWWNSGPPSTLKSYSTCEAKWSVMQWCVLMQCVLPAVLPAVWRSCS